MTGSDLSRRRLPLMRAESGKPGPVLWLTACGHGDEVTGMVVIQELFKLLRRQLRCGAVHAFPLMNPFGFENVSRDISVSSEDLNRSFPGNPEGTLGERIAHEIFTTITRTEPALVLDLHNDWIESIPYVLLDHHPGSAHKSVYKRAVAMGKQTGLCTIVDDEELHSSLSFNLLLNDIPALTLELGKPSTVSEPGVLYGLEAVRNCLAHLGMIAAPEETFCHPQATDFSKGKLLVYSDKPYGTRTGIIRFLVKPGSVVSAGQPLAKIVNAFGQHEETLIAPGEAIVLGYSDSAAAFPGMPIMSFGMPVKS